jgi:hypothetical protein
MTYFKADYVTGRIARVEAKMHRDGMVKIGNTRYKMQDDIVSDYASYHTSYVRAKDALVTYLGQKRDRLLAEAENVREMINFALGNY